MSELYLVFSERCLDGQLMNAHDMRRELIHAKYKKEYVSVTEVSPELKKELNEALNELEEIEALY